MKRARGPRLLGPSLRCPSRAATSRSAPAQAATTSRSTRPRRATITQSRPSSSRAASSTCCASASDDRAQVALVRRSRWSSPAEQAGRCAGRELLDVARRDVEKRHLGVVGQQLAGMPDTCPPRLLGDPDHGAHHTTRRANHKQAVHATRAGPTVQCPEPDELRDVDGLVVGMDDPPPQQRRQRPHIGDVGSDVDADEHREHRPGSARGDDGEHDQRRRQVVDEVREHGADGGDRHEGEEPGAVGQQRIHAPTRVRGRWRR